jgi:serine/threonine protein kinase/DNA-binding response OmpR family regulator
MSTLDRPTVLLVGEGDRMKAALEAALERHQMMVEGATTESVMETAFAAAPDVLLLIGDAAADGGRAVLKRLSNHPATSMVPVVLLSDEVGLDRRLAAFRHGVVAVVPRSASADGMARRVAELAREQPERSGETGGELGEATVDELVQLFSQQLRSGILSVTSGEDGAAAQVVLRAGRPVSEAIEALVERLRPLIRAPSGPLRFEFHESPSSRLSLLDQGEQEKTDLDVLRGRRMLLIERNPAKADVLVQELRAHGALVVVADGEGAGLVRARAQDPEVVLIEATGVKAWALETLRTLRRDPRLRWASLVVVDADELWPKDAGGPDLGKLAAAMRPLVRADRELAERADKEDGFDTRLELTGPTRMLRALMSTGRGLRVSVAHPRARVEIDLAEGLVAGARALAPGKNETLAEGPAAIAALLVLGSGRVRIERKEAPKSANVMAPLDDALAAAAAEKPPIQPSIPPPAMDAAPGKPAGKGAVDPEALIHRLESLLERLQQVLPEDEIAALEAAPTSKHTPVPKPSAVPPPSRPLTAAPPPKAPLVPRPGAKAGAAPVRRARTLMLGSAAVADADPKADKSKRVQPWERPSQARSEDEALPVIEATAEPSMPPAPLELAIQPMQLVPIGTPAQTPSAPPVFSAPSAQVELASVPSAPSAPPPSPPAPSTRPAPAAAMPSAPPPPPSPSAPPAPEPSVVVDFPMLGAMEEPTIRAAGPPITAESLELEAAPPKRGRTRWILGALAAIAVLVVGIVGVAIAIAFVTSAPAPESISRDAPPLRVDPIPLPPRVAIEPPPNAERPANGATETELENAGQEDLRESPAEDGQPENAETEAENVAPEDPDAEEGAEEEAADPGAEEAAPGDRAERVRQLIRTANYQRNRGNHDAAQANYQRVLQLDRRNARALAGLAHSAIARRDARAAVRWSARLVSVAPSNPHNHVLLGDAYQLAGNRQSALREWRRALQISPENETARRRLGGIGGMAEVFKAMHRGVGGFERLVAIKRLHPAIAADTEIVRLFIEEAKLAVQLSHPCIAQIFDLGREGDDYFVAMEYVDGHSLKTLLSLWAERGSVLPLDATCHLGVQVADALYHAHHAQDPLGRPLGVIHRDVSPGNILISFGGEVKVIDFGLAKAANRVSETRDGMVKGRLAYLSPEQAQGKPIDPRSDLFSLGICLWEMLTGKRAYDRADERDAVLAIRHGAVDPPSRHADVPPEIEAIVMRALAPDPSARYSSAHQLRQDLEGYVHGAGLEFGRRQLHALMRSTFPERFAEEAEGADEKRHPSLPLDESDDLDPFEDDLDTEPRASELPEDQPIEGSDTLPGIVIPDDRER